MTTPQIVFVAGHETGHYVLNHVPKGLFLSSLFSLLVFYLAFLGLGLIQRSFGARLGIRSLDDIASLPLMLLILTLLTFLGNPIVNGVSRYIEHEADQYALELTHGLTPDSAQVAAQSFQVLGEVGLSDPDPNWLNVFLFYSHPPISERVRFCLEYDPMSKR
jgi:Zn-dependent protease with chaperone function